MRAVIKRVLPERATDEKFITAFLDEANLASQLRHPNIVTIHDFGNDQGTYFIAMEFIDGENLLEIMKACENKVPIKYTLYIIAEACKGLDYAHNKIDDFTKKSLNIVHRDVSPQNILVAFDGDVKIVDFGIAKATQRQGKNTTVGIVKGKLLYMSREQASGKTDIDRKSDIFSLGLLFYELLSGESAYNGETFQEILTLACQAKMITIGERVKNLPADLNQIVKKVLEPEPENRYQTAELLIKDIIKFLRKNPEFRCSKAEMAKFMQEKCKDKKKPQS
jgi:serine/threonine-protein kinase